MELNELEKIKLLKSKVLELNHNNIHYYVKENASLTELIGKYLCDILHITCASYEPFKINDTYYVASPDLNSNGQFIEASKLINESENNLRDIIAYFKNNFSNSSELINDILRVYLFDIIFMNSDRYSSNWGILNGRVVVLDNTGIFSNDLFTLMGVSSTLENIYVSLESAIKSYNDILPLLEEFLQITPDVFSDIITHLEQIYKVKIIKKKSYKYLYKNHYQKISELVNKYRGDEYAKINR